jgi:hypothetical protein
VNEDEIGRVAGLVTGHLAEGDRELAVAELSLLEPADVVAVALRLGLRLAVEVDPDSPAARA